MVGFKTEGMCNTVPLVRLLTNEHLTDEGPTTPSRHIDDDRVTITITVPRSVIEGNKIDVMVTPHSQRTARPDQPGGNARGVDPGTPRRPPPRFEYPGGATHSRTPANSRQFGDDPFESEENICRSPDVDVSTPNLDSDNDCDNVPYLVYPLRGGGSVPGLSSIAQRPRGYFVVTQGKRIGVFLDVW
jgi:hypothetical protein